MDFPRELGRIESRLKRYERKTLAPQGLTPAAITLPLVRGEDGGLELLFTLRSLEVEHHKGEISFPGGKVEPWDNGIVDAALRETSEETGMAPDEVVVVGLLDDHVSVSGFLVTPVVIYLPGGCYGLCPAPCEVCEIFCIPLSHLADGSNHKELKDSGTADFHEFFYGDRRIWGLTASVLHRFLQITLDFGEEGIK